MMDTSQISKTSFLADRLIMRARGLWFNHAVIGYCAHNGQAVAMAAHFAWNKSSSLWLYGEKHRMTGTSK